ncbi:hypothetical protein C0992_012616, partial [Termitomyces sp. T32_za158]
PNRKALEDLITKPEVERKLLIRLQKKAATYAQDIGIDTEILPDGSPKISGYGGVNGSAKIDVDGVVDLYESFIIPLTKEVEVRSYHEHLRQRCLLSNRWSIFFID